MDSGKVPAAVLTRIAPGTCPNDTPSSLRDSAEPAPNAGAKQRDCLLASFCEAEIEEVDSLRQHYRGLSADIYIQQDLASAYREEQTLKACLDNCPDCLTVEDAWHVLGEKFTLLRDFAGGLATVFPSTAAVESDFSLF
jgi:hypothetical protein